jgi:hypothetical protein
MKTTITLKSGHHLVINAASLGVSGDLMRTISSELKANVKLASLSTGVVFGLLTGNLGAVVQSIGGNDLDVLAQLLLTLLGSKKIYDSFFECARTCTLDAMGPMEKITEASFEPVEVRRDLIPVAKEVMRENLAPFFVDLLSTLQTQESTTASSPP